MDSYMLTLVKYEKQRRRLRRRGQDAPLYMIPVWP